ncbi:hypothetical protein K3495_g13565, partial [Podosphaera aphanis]
MSSASFSTNPSSGVIILKGTQNYLEWIYTIKMASNGNSSTDIKNVWKFIDPKSNEKPDLPGLSPRPTPADVNPAATSISKLSVIELEDFKYRDNIWKEKKMEIQEIERRLEGIQNKILGSISESLLPQLKGASNVKEILLHLSNKFRPSDQARRQEIIQNWNSLKSPPSDRKILPWLDEWESVYEEGKEMKLSIVESPQAQYDFLFAARSINEAWATANLVAIGIDIEYDRIVSDFPGYLKEFRQHQRLNEIFLRNAENSANLNNSSGVFAATNDIRDGSSSDPSTIHKGRKQNGDKICLCGYSHLYEKCFYLNFKNTKRPSNFKFRKEIFDKINNRLSQSSMENLRKTFKSKFGYDPTSTPSQALQSDYAGFFQQRDSENQGNDLGIFTTSLEASPDVETSLITADQTSSSEFHLKNHWVLDSGSDVHICNNENLHGFQRTEPFLGNHHIVSGTTKYPVKAWGTCRVKILTEKSDGYITLSKVALIPGFMTSLVSLHLMNVKNVHWNSMEPLHLFRSDGTLFCNLFQSGRHWTFEKSPIENNWTTKSLEKSQSVCLGVANEKKENKTRHKTFDKAQLHRIFGHPSPEIVDRIASAARDGTITVLDTVPAPRTIQCETCALSKSHQHISKILDKEHPQTKPFERVTVDLIPMRKAAHDLEIRQYDVVNAFVNAPIRGEVYCHAPKGYNSKFQGKPIVLKLLKALYGFKFSPLYWYDEFLSFLLHHGFNQVPGVNCMVTNQYINLIFYVDDIMITFNESDTSLADNFDHDLATAFEVRRITKTCSFLGIRIVRDRPARKLWLCQDSYIESLASTFHVVGGKSPKTPIPQLVLMPFEGTATAAQIKGYQQKVGKVNFAAVTTRPDIARAVSILSRFLTNPGPQHINAIDHLIQYLVGTPYMAICYNGKYYLQKSPSTKRAFMTFSDASYGDDPETRHSSCGFALLLYGGIVHYKATKQKTVTTSSTEAELLAVSTLAKEYLWWIRLFENIGLELNQDAVISLDNQQTIRLITKDAPKLVTKLKHIDIHQLWIRQEYQAGNIKVEWVPTADMVADGFT